ncbi:MAG: hypothetical protein LPK85_08325 [Gammaproteobacteria bacterium]|nr:hypothetical protein [Gammaproteobacteria bacterium]
MRPAHPLTKPLPRLTALLCTLAIGAILIWQYQQQEAGQCFWSEARFSEWQKGQGWIPIGRFEPGFPACIRRVQHAEGDLHFTRADGSRHTYSGFGAYPLKVVHLRAWYGARFEMVMRGEGVERR